MTRCSCAALGCSNTTCNSELDFYRFPKTIERFLKWAQIINRDDVKANTRGHYFICEKHFEKHYLIENPLSSKKKLRHDAVPTLHLFHGESDFMSDRKRIFNYQCQSSSEERGSKQGHGSTRQKETRKNVIKKIKTDRVGNSKKLIHKRICKQKYCTLFRFKYLCNKFLPVDIGQQIKEQAELNVQIMRKLYERKNLSLYLKIYHSNPLGPELLKDALGAQKKNNIDNFYARHFTKDQEMSYEVLKVKVSCMQNDEKICSILVRRVPIKPYLYYNKKQDKLFGFHDIDGKQTMQLAKYAIVVMVRGIYKDWHLPVDVALLYERDHEDVAPWFNIVLSRLFVMGLRVLVCISNLKPDILITTNISFLNPYFIHNDRKIFFMSNPDYLMHQIGRILMKYPLRFLGLETNWEHILKLYKIDSKRQYKLVPKLTDDHMIPKKTQAKHLTKDLLSEEVASGLLAYMDFGQIDEAALGTVKFVTVMSKLNDFLQSYVGSDNDEKEKLHVIHEAIQIFYELEICNDVTSKLPLFGKFLITLKSILLLFAEIKNSELHSTVTTKFLSMDVLNKMIIKLKRKSDMRQYTCLNLIRAYKKKFSNEIMKPYKNKQIAKNFIKSIAHLIQNELNLKDCLKKFENGSVSVNVDYKSINLPEKFQFLYVCGFVLEKINECHKGCDDTLRYLTFDETNIDDYSIYLEYKEICPVKLPRIPRDSLVIFLQNFEAILQKFFKTDLMVESQARQLLHRIREKTNSLKFESPCSCFPESYLRELYIRIRLFHLISMNNKDYETQPSEASFKLKFFT